MTRDYDNHRFYVDGHEYRSYAQRIRARREYKQKRSLAFLEAMIARLRHGYTKGH